MPNPSGPQLRGGNISLEKILAPTDVTHRQTKIICTLGPACWDIETLCQLIDAGMSVARFNFSHGDHEGHKACLDRLRQAAAITKKNVGMYSIARNGYDSPKERDFLLTLFPLPLDSFSRAPRHERS